MAIVKFKNGFQGEYQVNDEMIHIGKGKVAPYDMTFGAIASCLYATMLDYLLAHDMKVESADIIVNGTKREEVPTWLTHISILVRVVSSEPMERLEAALQNAYERCSMVQTFAKVAQIDCQIEKK